MIERILAAYPAKEPAICIITLAHPVFHIYDPISLDTDGAAARLPCTFRLGSEKQDQELTVRNNAMHPVHLVAIDCCLFASSDPSRCDCALVQEETIRFVEFKHGNYRRRTECIQDCIKQLANSINDFYSMGILSARPSILLLPALVSRRSFHHNASLEALSARLNLLISADVLVELHVTDTTTFG